MNNEQERLKRLRERQLTDRDPLVKQKQFQRTTAQKERKARGKRYTLGEAWRTIPHIYRSPFIGLLIGLAAMFIVPVLWDSPWAFWVALGATGFFVFLGMLTGRAQDLREDLKDAIKH
ncbi:MAG TPA: hypothetical protein VLM78_06840 [Anaerolineales bacterium]|nr:hypothetical protein [Anaerolineales bacterium]